MAVGRGVYDVLKVERMNYEDLGNWVLDDPGGVMHLDKLTLLGRKPRTVWRVGKAPTAQDFCGTWSSLRGLFSIWKRLPSY
jgi:hypothetical protein